MPDQQLDTCSACHRVEVFMCRSAMHPEPVCGLCCKEAAAIDRWGEEMGRKTSPRPADKKPGGRDD